MEQKMKVVLYGVPESMAERIAGRYGLCRITQPDQLDRTDAALLLVGPMEAPRRLLALYNALSRYEEEIDAVIVCGLEGCAAASTVLYCAPQGRFFSLCGVSDDAPEETEEEIDRILEALSDTGNRLNL